MANFGLFRGFSEKLFEGEIPINLGLIGSQKFFTDPDATAFFERVTAAGGTLTETEQLAIDTLVKDMKDEGIWNKMKVIYPMVGASAAACAQNLKSSSFTGVFSGGWTFASTGVTPNGSNAFLNTNFNPASNLIIASSHQSQYQRNNQSQNGVPGVWDGGGATLRLEFATNTSAFIGSCKVESNGAGTTAPAISDTRGLIVGTSFSPTLKLFRNTTSLVSRASGTTNFPNRNYYFGALNNNGDAGFFTNMPFAFASLGDGLSDEEVSDFVNCVQTFQTTLNRQV